MVDPMNIVIILNLEAPRSVKRLCANLGHIKYYIKFIKSYAQITATMEKLLKKDVTLSWNDDCMKCLDVLKGKLASAPIPVFPKWDVEFHVHVDASYHVGSSAHIRGLRRFGSPYRVWKPEVVQSREELFHHRARGVSDGVPTPKVQTLFTRRTFQDVCRPFYAEIPGQ